MGKTIIEKIIQAHTEDEVASGKIIWMKLDVRSARDFGGPNVVKNYEREYRGLPVAGCSRTFFTFDLCVPATLIRYAQAQQVCRDFARKYGIKVFDVDKGIGSHVLIEEGLAFPGSTVVGTDSHLNILGAVGCFGQGMGDVDITFAFRTGKTWFEVPETVKVLIKGSFSFPATAKDLTLFILKELGTKKAASRAIEFYGEAVRDLTLAGRITLCSMVTEAAGVIGFIPEYNSSLTSEVEELTGKRFSHLQADEDVDYSEVIELDASSLVPQVAAPFSPVNVMSVDEFKGKKIQSGFIGSCTNGRVEDFVQAARVLKGRKVKEDVMLKIVPATRRVYGKLLEMGIIEEFFKSGAIVSSPGCGGCAEGHIGLTGEGEVQISTGNRNFAGKQGKGETYLASPEVVAASCIQGEITSPGDL